MEGSNKTWLYLLKSQIHGTQCGFFLNGEGSASSDWNYYYLSLSQPEISDIN